MEEIKKALSNIIGTNIDEEKIDKLIECVLKKVDIDYIIDTIGEYKILSHIDTYEVLKYYGSNQLLYEIDKEDAMEFYGISDESDNLSIEDYSPIELINEACSRINGSTCYDKEEGKKMIASEIDFYW